MDKMLSLDLLESVASLLDRETTRQFALCSHTTRLATHRYPSGDLKVDWHLCEEILASPDPERILSHQRGIRISLRPDDPMWTKSLTALLHHCQNVRNIEFKVLVAARPLEVAVDCSLSNAHHPCQWQGTSKVSPTARDLPLISRDLHQKHSTLSAFLWVRPHSELARPSWPFDGSLEFLLHTPCLDFRVFDAVLDPGIYFKMTSVAGAIFIMLANCLLPEFELHDWFPATLEAQRSSTLLRSVNIIAPELLWTGHEYVENSTSSIWPFMMQTSSSLEAIYLNVLPASLSPEQDALLSFPKLIEMRLPNGNFHAIVKWSAMPVLSQLMITEVCPYSQEGLERIASGAPDDTWFRIHQASTAVYPGAMKAINGLAKTYKVDISLSYLSISVRELDEEARSIFADVRSLIITWEFDDEFDFKGKAFECDRLHELIVVVEEGAEGFEVLAEVIKPGRRLRDGMQVFFKKSRNCDWR